MDIPHPSKLVSNFIHITYIINIIYIPYRVLYIYIIITCPTMCSTDVWVSCPLPHTPEMAPLPPASDTRWLLMPSSLARRKPMRACSICTWRSTSDSMLAVFIIISVSSDLAHAARRGQQAGGKQVRGQQAAGRGRQAGGKQVRGQQAAGRGQAGEGAGSRQAGRQAGRQQAGGRGQGAGEAGTHTFTTSHTLLGSGTLTPRAAHVITRLPSTPPPPHTPPGIPSPMCAPPPAPPPTRTTPHCTAPGLWW